MFKGSIGRGCAVFLLLGMACNGEKPVTPPPVAPRPVTPPPVAPTASTAEPPVSPPPETPVVCNAVETRAGAKRDTKRIENKIVGGKPSTPGNWPYAVALAQDSGGKLRQYCGASLIGKKWVLTAAHCQVMPGDKAIVGRRDLSKNDGEVIAVARTLNHAAYDADTSDNDVAVLELTKEVTSEFAGIHAGASDLAGEKSTVVGWGFLKEGGPSPTALQEVEVPVVSNQTCSAGYASDSISITDNMLCAGLGQGGKDSCQGDSGGPLLVKSADGKWQQAGVVSFGIGCARPQKYGVYTRVAKYGSWIAACTK